MKLTTLTKLLKLSLLGFTVSLSSCSDDKQTGNDQDKSEQKAVSLEPILLKEAPINAIAIADLRRTATPGETVTFAGKAMGGHDIFMDGRAVMVLGDPAKITSCDLIPGDGCKTPWDVCCDDPEVIKASIVTVQVVDESGKPQKADLRGLGGITELSNVIVTGKVAKGSNKDNMIINATGIYVLNSEESKAILPPAKVIPAPVPAESEESLKK